MVICLCELFNIITRKIDMMGLIYGESASQSSGINKDFFHVEYLGGMDNSSFFKSL